MPVTKYDRKGYKARPRQLLLTSNSAVIVEEAKLKQRIDYGALKGPRLRPTVFYFFTRCRWLCLLMIPVLLLQVSQSAH